MYNPNTSWFDAFATAVYLINHLPSSFLEKKSPYKMLFNCAPNYAIFKPLGCRVFPYLRDYAANKLSPWVIQVFFWGTVVHIRFSHSSSCSVWWTGVSFLWSSWFTIKGVEFWVFWIRVHPLVSWFLLFVALYLIYHTPLHLCVVYALILSLRHPLCLHHWRILPASSCWVTLACPAWAGARCRAHLAAYACRLAYQAIPSLAPPAPSSSHPMVIRARAEFFKLKYPVNIIYTALLSALKMPFSWLLLHL